MFLRRKKKFKVDLSEIEEDELEDERESLISFLHQKLKVDVASSGNKLLVNSENLSSKELRKLVNKFVYRRNLMNRYWVSLEGNVVKINKFEHAEKKKKRKTRGTPPSTIKHGW